MNPFFQAIGQTGPFGNIAKMKQQFSEFRQNFRGDPKAEIEKMLQSGQITQAQLNQAQQMAQQMAHIFR